MNHSMRVEKRIEIINMLEGQFNHQIDVLLNEWNTDDFLLTFFVDCDKPWKVLTNMPYIYSSMGYSPKELYERIVYIKVSGYFLIDGKKVSDSPVNITFEVDDNGSHKIKMFDSKVSGKFLNLFQQAQNAVDLYSSEEIDVDKYMQKGGVLSQSSPIQEEPTRNNVENTDYRIDEIVACLRCLNYSRANATRLAHEALSRNLELHDIDTLVETALELDEESAS